MKIKSLDWNKLWSNIKKKIPLSAVVWFFVYYAFALVLLLSSYFFNDFSMPKFFSSFLSWSVTLLIPNIFLSTSYLFSKKTDLVFSTLYLAVSLFFAFLLFGAYLLYNLATKFQDFIGTSPLLLLVILGVINFKICYSLAKPIFERDVIGMAYVKKFKEADVTKSETSEMKSTLKQGRI